MDGGQRPGISTGEAQRIAELEREVRELRRANDILKAAASFFAGAGPATAQVVEFIDEHREIFGGVEPICRVLRDAGVQIAPSTYYEFKNRQPSARAQRGEVLIPLIVKIYNENHQVYGARKLWEEFARQGHRVVAPCTAERLMRRIGLHGVSPGPGPAAHHHRAGPGGPRAARPDLLRRDFTAPTRHSPGIARSTTPSDGYSASTIPTPSPPCTTSTGCCSTTAGSR